MANQDGSSSLRLSGESFFPLYITVERVRKGYIITYYDEGSVARPAGYYKEVVAESDIYRRLGELLHVDNLDAEKPVLYRIEVVSAKAYEIEGSVPLDSLTQAKIGFLHFKTKDAPRDKVWALRVSDSRAFEFYGDSALAVARGLGRNPETIQRIGGVAVLTFPADNETMKQVAKAAPNFQFIDVSEHDVLDWFRRHSPDPSFTSTPQNKTGTNNKDKDKK